MKMSHEEYVEMKRKRVGVLALGMLDGSINYLEGADELSSLLFEIEVSEEDQDFLAFDVVASETNHLPLGEPSKYWSKEALERHEPEIQKLTQWAREFSLTECKSLSERFSA